jgi:hypothetical protein
MFQSLLNSSASELAQSQTVVLSANTITKVKFSPSSMQGDLLGYQVIFSLSITSGSTAGNATTVGSSLYSHKITTGPKTMINLSGFREFQDFYHIKNGTILNDVTLTPSASSTVTETLSAIVPFVAPESEKLVFEFEFNGYQSLAGSSATGGQVTVIMRYFYGIRTSEYDFWTVVPAPSPFNAGVEVNIANYINDARPAIELWTDIASDGNLNYYKFENGKVVIFDDLDVNSLIEYEDYYPMYNHLSGLLYLPIQSEVVIDSNANTSIKPLLNLSNSLAPIFFLKVLDE